MEASHTYSETIGVFIRVFSAGNGDYYSSGNDLSNFTNVQPGEMKKMADNGAALLK